MTIYNKHGQQVYRSVTRSLGFNTGEICGKGEIICTIEALLMIAGKYWVTVACWDSTGFIPYDHHEKMYTFELEKGSGIPNEWEVKLNSFDLFRRFKQMSRLIQRVKYFIYRIQFAIPIIKLFPAYLRDNFRNRTLRLKETDKCILFTLDNNEYLFRDDDSSGREAYYILKAFSDGGYNVYFYRPCDFKKLLAFKATLFGRLIYGIKNLKFISKIPANIENFIYAFDSCRPELLNLPWEKLKFILISKKAVTSRVGNVIPMQFYMMPYIHACGENENVGQYRDLTRKYRIFFAGNLSPTYYDSPIFKRKYPHLARMTRLGGIKSAMDSTELDIWLIKKSDDFKRISK